MSLDAMITQARARQVEREAEQERQKLAEEQAQQAKQRDELVELMKKHLGQQFIALCAIGYNSQEGRPYAHIVHRETDVHIYYVVEGEDAYWDVRSLIGSRDITIFSCSDNPSIDEVRDGVMLAIDELTK